MVKSLVLKLPSEVDVDVDVDVAEAAECVRRGRAALSKRWSMVLGCGKCKAEAEYARDKGKGLVELQFVGLKIEDGDMFAFTSGEDELLIVVDLRS